MFLICSASRISSFCLLFWYSNIVVFPVRIFRNSIVRHECFFKCCAMELISERCIVSLLNRGIEVKPTFSEIQSPKGHLNWYITLFFLQNSNGGRGIIFNDLVGGFKFIIVYNKFYFFNYFLFIYLRVSFNKFHVYLYILFKNRQKCKR